jgi:hypothetical protein
MASINDLYNQLVTVNGAISQVYINTSDEVTATSALNTSVGQVNTSVGQLDTDVRAGFAATVSALNTIKLIDVELAKLLFHLTQQADTMICALEKISQNTCGILTEVTIQTRLQTSISEDVHTLSEIAASAYPAATLELERLAALRAEVRRCCPPVEPKPACTYTPCPSPQPVQMPKLPVDTVQ